MIETTAHTHGVSTLLALFRAPKPSEHGPLARIAREDRVCHSCRRRLPVNETGGRLEIRRDNGRVQIHLRQMLARSQATTATTLAEARTGTPKSSQPKSRSPRATSFFSP